MNADSRTRLGLVRTACAGLLALAVWLLAGAGARPALTQAGIVVTEAPAPQFRFGEALTFRISARSPEPITEATVFYRAAKESRTVAGAARFTSGEEITAVYTVDLAARPLPPFSPVEYWWELRDRGGAVFTSDRRVFVYEDNRFTWQTRERDAVAVHWYAGDNVFGQAALDAATAAVSTANRDLKAPLPDPVDIYVYAGAADLQAALRLVGQAWAGGHADPALGVVVVSVAPGLEARAALERVVPHEVTHLLVYAAAGGGDGYRGVPGWLNEGLAVMNQAEPDADFPAAITRAMETGSLLSLESLCARFPDAPAQAQLAYAQSESMVRYIRDRNGASGLTALLAAYADGAGCEAGVQRALGLSLAELESDWQTDWLHASPATLKLRALAPWILIGALVVLAPLGSLWLARPRARARGAHAAP